MDIFDFLELLGGLCLFLFGMNVMGQALERRAGNKLTTLIGKLTGNRFKAFLTGLGVTAIIQSSSATTVMVVGFVNSGIMTLKQSIGIIMGANIGTTVTAWILSLGGISSDVWWIQLMKPTSFTPLLALIGIVFYMFCKSNKKKDTGLILLGFAVLMFGMDIMSGAVAGLKDVPAFRDMFLLFKEPILGVLVGAVLTAIIQSSSASVGILQALAITGQISYGAAFPIIMGQNIGTCITAILSSFGTNRNARRVALVHLLFNVIGTTLMVSILYIAKAFFQPPLLDMTADAFGIAVSHSIFNVVCTAVLFPAAGILEKLACILVPDGSGKDKKTVLDERLLATPALALDSCRKHAFDMAKCAAASMKDSIYMLSDFKSALADDIREREEQTDHYEDIIGDYLVKLSSQRINEDESAESARLLQIIGDLERIGDHSVNILESAEELREKKIVFTDGAKQELQILTSAVNEITAMAVEAFVNNDLLLATRIEPLEEVIDDLKEQLRTRHIKRLQMGKCSIDAGFIWSDLLNDLERTSDHCSNIAGCLIETAHNDLNIHETLRSMKKNSPEYTIHYETYQNKYSVSSVAE